MRLDGPRGCVPEEVPAIVELANRVFERAAGDMGRKFPTLFCAGNAPWLRTFWDGGRPVALVGVWCGAVVSSAGSLRVAHVGAVATVPEARGRGLATALLEDAFARLHAAGTSLVFISGARGLYLRLGARRFGRLWRYRWTGGPEAGPAPAVRAEAVHGLRPEEWGALRRLYAAEPVHYLRSAADWRALLPAKGYLPAAGGRGLYLVRRAGVPAAYLLVGAARRAEPGAAGVRCGVDEFAGEREAVVAALPQILEARGAEALDLLVQGGDESLHALLRGHGLAPAPAQHSGTVRLLHAGAFLDVVAGVRPDLQRLAHAAPFDSAAGVAEAVALTAAAFGGEGEDREPRPARLEPVELPRPDGLQFI